MYRIALTLALIAAATLPVAAPALASQCPKLINQISGAAGNRLDNAGYAAREKAAEAAKLHGEGKHADSVKAAQEGLKMLGM